MIVEAGTGDAVKLVVEAGNGPGAEGVNQAIPGVAMPHRSLLGAGIEPQASCHGASGDCE